jgi:LysR family transcriptional regulator, hydrogen peroxide-inducible genes activator
MNIRDLKYLLALIEHRHFGKAAEACFVSQPALSTQIKKLETNLGVTLLERSNKSVILTEVGLQLGDYAQQILHLVDGMYEVAKLAQNPLSGAIKLGLIPTSAPYLLPHIMASLTHSFPLVDYFLIEEQTHILLEKLTSGAIDAAILVLPIALDFIEYQTLFAEEFVLAIFKQHPLASKAVIDEAELIDQELLLLDDGHCLRDQALAICQRVKAHESHCFKATSLETLRYMVAAGVGMTFMPKLACLTNDGIIYIPFTEPKPKRQLALCWRKTNVKKILLQKIAETIIANLAPLM